MQSFMSCFNHIYIYIYMCVCVCVCACVWYIYTYECVYIYIYIYKHYISRPIYSSIMLWSWILQLISGSCKHFFKFLTDMVYLLFSSFRFWYARSYWNSYSSLSSLQWKVSIYICLKFYYWNLIFALFLHTYFTVVFILVYVYSSICKCFLS